MKLGQGNVFTGVCDSVHRGGSASVHAGIPLPPSRNPPRADPPGPGRPPRSRQTPPHSTPPEADCSIRSTSGRYASYWNAFLLLLRILLRLDNFTNMVQFFLVEGRAAASDFELRHFKGFYYICFNTIINQNGRKCLYHSHSGWRHNLIDGQDGHVRYVREDVDDSHQTDRDHNGQWKISVKRKKFNIVLVGWYTHDNTI